MSRYKRVFFKPYFLILLVCSWIILAGLFKPIKLFPKQKKDGKFQIEFYGGFSTLNPADLNMIVDYDRQIQNFFYDDYYNYLRNKGEISSWQKDIQGNRVKIKNAYPFGFRLKYYLNKSIGLSLGFKYLSNNRSADLIRSYTRIEGGYTLIDKHEYSPYTLSVKGLTPMIGLHFVKNLKKALEIGAYITGGPIFAKCSHRVQWASEWLFRAGNYTLPLYMSSGFVEENGQGTGFALDLGGRIDVILNRKIKLFMEIGYAHQVANNISGSGSESTGLLFKEWQGEWGIKEENIETEWGSIVLQCPTNYWEGWLKEQRAGNFKLDLSGFQLRIGMSYEF